MKIGVTNEKLLDKRKFAAEVTAGISNDHSIYDAIERLVAKYSMGGSVLDFGSGTGNLTSRLIKANTFDSVHAADLIEPPDDIASLSSWTTCDLNEPTPFPSSSFDVVVSSEVIEHLENPRAVSREWFRLLRPGGKLVFSTPNNESWRSILALVIKRHFTAFSDGCYPEHITALVGKDIQRIMAETGFISTTISYSNSGGLPRFAAIKWQTISAGILKGCRFSDNIIAMATKPGNGPAC